MCTERVKIERFHKTEKETVEDVVIQEIPFTLYINNKEFVTLTTIPQYLRELTVGFLFTEGFIERLNDIKFLSINSKEFTARLSIPSLSRFPENKRLVTSGCGSSMSFYREWDLKRIKVFTDNFKIPSTKVITLMKEFQKMADLFVSTGGVHGAAISDLSGIKYYCEDIGRHNAVDKVIGMMMLNGRNFFPKILLVTGRVSSEILKKAIASGIPVIISRSAPTLLSIRGAEKVNLTLLGFVRGERFNVYSGNERIG